MSVYPFDLTIMWNTIRILCLHEKGDYDILYRIEEKVSNVIYVWTSLNLVKVF